MVINKLSIIMSDEENLFLQETLSKQVKEDLMKQNLSVPHLKRTIEHLEIALWFLSFGIGDPNQSLKLYITETLHINPDPGMEVRFWMHPACSHVCNVKHCTTKYNVY